MHNPNYHVHIFGPVVRSLAHDTNSGWQHGRRHDFVLRGANALYEGKEGEGKRAGHCGLGWLGGAKCPFRIPCRRPWVAVIVASVYIRANYRRTISVLVVAGSDVCVCGALECRFSKSTSPGS